MHRTRRVPIADSEGKRGCGRRIKLAVEHDLTHGAECLSTFLNNNCCNSYESKAETCQSTFALSMNANSQIAR